MKQISCIIPTLWIPDTFYKSCDVLNANQFIKEVIIINNNNNNKKKIDFLKYGNHTVEQPILLYDKDYIVDVYGKFKILTPPSNVYVSESWNVGVITSNSNIICLLNDDVIVEEETFRLSVELLNSSTGIIGIKQNCFNNLTHTNEYEIVAHRPIAFGCCMIMHKENYIEIPPVLKIWYNDDFLFDNVKGTHYCLTGAKIAGSVSATLNNNTHKSEFDEIINQDRIEYFKLKEKNNVTPIST